MRESGGTKRIINNIFNCFYSIHGGKVPFIIHSGNMHRERNGCSLAEAPLDLASLIIFGGQLTHN